MTAIGLLQTEREMIRQAEQKVDIALLGCSPGRATSNILNEYINLSNDSERAALVSVLATRLAIKQLIPSANI